MFQVNYSMEQSDKYHKTGSAPSDKTVQDLKMKFKYLFENDLITLSEVPLHIQDLGEVFACVSDADGADVYIVNHDGWRAYTILNGKAAEYNPLIRVPDPKKLLIQVSQDFMSPVVKYVVS